MRDRVLALSCAIIFTLIVYLMTPSLAQQNSINPLQINSPTGYTEPFEIINTNSTILLTIEVKLLHTNGFQTNPFILQHGQSLVSNIPFDPIQYSPTIKRIFYSLDDKDNITLAIPSSGSPIYISFSQFGICLSIYQTIYNVSNGMHTLKAYALGANGEYFSDQDTFMVNSSFRIPSISIVSPLNQTYSKRDVPLNYLVIGEFSSLYYTVDFQRGINLKGNTTLTNLTEGSHYVRVSGLSTKHYIGSSSQYFYFSINTSKAENPLNQNNQTNIMIVNISIIVVTIATVTVLSVILFRRKKGNNFGKFSLRYLLNNRSYVSISFKILFLSIKQR
jgi:hypothetical protein